MAFTFNATHALNTALLLPIIGALFVIEAMSVIVQVVSFRGFGGRRGGVVFDHLVAPTAFYISKEEFEDWWKDAKAQDVEIVWHNSNSWCGFGRI